MSWNFLSYGIPLFSGLKALSAYMPATYREYNEAPESIYSGRIKAVIERVLNELNQPGSPHQEQIQELIEDLPHSAGTRDIKTWVATRLKVVTIKNKLDTPIHAIGTCVDIEKNQGSFFIGIDPDIDPSLVDALPWVVTHEVCHILELDWIGIGIIKTITSLFATILSTAVFGWGLLPSAGMALSANIVTHAIAHRRAENKADDFASQHCSEEERLKAIAALKQIKNARPERASSYFNQILRAAFHPSEDARIAKICLKIVSDKLKTA